MPRSAPNANIFGHVVVQLQCLRTVMRLAAALTVTVFSVQRQHRPTAKTAQDTKETEYR